MESAFECIRHLKKPPKDPCPVRFQGLASDGEEIFPCGLMATSVFNEARFGGVDLVFFGNVCRSFCFWGDVSRFFCFLGDLCRSFCFWGLSIFLLMRMFFGESRSTCQLKKVLLQEAFGGCFP